MSPAPYATLRAGRRGAWLRVLVLLLALALPCAHVTGQAAPPVPVAGASGGGVGEYDHLDTATRTPARSVRRGVVPPCAAPTSAPTAGPRQRSFALPVPAGLPSTPRSVVLRC
ncbi:hypothetical protein [Streptomyces sp. AC602_WCS936]|uniref:hypothetical protein n=1 Tax=Streptomyces sp. AC602_WCS936 TaxID=2823685 RepID=UPI001C27D58D|nr:hypothetical protein [Streptomyces sp. AC602_WCS936]